MDSLLSKTQPKEAKVTQVEAGSTPRLPAGWTDFRFCDVIAHYESQSDDEAVAEDEAAFGDDSCTVMAVPCELVPVVQALLTEYADHRISR